MSLDSPGAEGHVLLLVAGKGHRDCPEGACAVALNVNKVTPKGVGLGQEGGVGGSWASVGWTMLLHKAGRTQGAPHAPAHV